MMGSNFDRVADFIIVSTIITIVVLKFLGVITIPWIWLLSPIWGCFGIGIIIALIVAIIYFIECIKEKKNERY